MTTKKKIEMVPCVNPATGERFDEIPMATKDEISQAILEMRQNFEIWHRKSAKERARILRKFQAIIIDSLDIISETITKDTGKSRQDGLIEVLMTVDRLHQYYKRAPSWLARRRVPPGLYFFRRYYTEPQPYGVVAIIAPWNLPFDLSVSPLCSALLAGNTVLLKPSEVTGATGALIEKLLQSVPELSPFVRVLHGDGRVGKAVVQAKPDLIFLTGSVPTGKKVAQEASKNLTPYLLELGGKDPMIVLEDADIKAAAHWGVWASYYNTGQLCVSVERVYVVESVYDAFLAEALEEMREVTLGYSLDINNPYHLSPLTFERQRDIIQDHLNDAVARGARILCGGYFDKLFLEPTVIVDVDHNMKIMRDETFGPVMPIMKVKDEAEAIRLANDSHYGLSASVWSQNRQRAEKVGRQLQVGSVIINDAISHYGVSLLPFGGVKKSGSARTHDKSEVLQFTQLHSYSIGRSPLPFDLATQMRYPGHYRLGKAVTRLAFGVTPRQRLEPIVEEVERINKARVGRSARSRLPAAGLLAGLAAILFGLWHLGKR